MPTTTTNIVNGINSKSLDIFWWNTNNFYHFDDKKIKLSGKTRWPQSATEYAEKCSRVETALKALFKSSGIPSIIALGEITKGAAEEIRNRVLPSYNLISLDTDNNHPTLQIAVLHAKNTADIKFEEKPPIVANLTPESTRPMLVLDVVTSGNILRCIICHWQARMGETSDEYRRKTAYYLSEYAYDFLHSNSPETKNIVIIGDLNEEPYELAQSVLNAHRSRLKSTLTKNYADSVVKRAHLYNCTWRLLGEKFEHNPVLTRTTLDIAGSFYWEKHKSWHQLDQIIVSGGLLSNKKPYIDESKISIVSLDEFMPDKVPKKFSFNKATYEGLSDHLPIFATINL